MISVRDQYADLLALTKEFLLQEHSLTDRLISEPETYFYFRSYAQQRQEVKALTSAKPQILAPSQHVPIVQSSPSYPPKREISTAEVNSTSPAMQKKPLPASGKIETTQPTKTVSSAKENGSFKLEQAPVLQPVDFADIKKIVHEKFPHVRLLDQLPDDAEAQKLAKMWMQEKKIPQVLILSFDEVPKHLAFLANLVKALEMHGISASIRNAAKLEQEAKWGDLLKSTELKLVVASSSGFYHLPELQKNYKEGTKQGRHYLGDHLLLLLSDIGFYFKEPALKPSLWSALKELLATVSAAP